MASTIPQAPEDLVRVIRSIQKPTLAQIAKRLSDLKIAGDFKRFLVARMGSTGSTWFAKLLDSHPDVYCTHEGIVSQVYPQTEYSEEDVFRFIEYFAWDTKHGAYGAVGDVGSVWTLQLEFLPSFTTGLLIRHPARVLYTRLSTFGKNQSFTKIPAESEIGLRDVWGIHLNRYDPIDKIFLNDMMAFAAQLSIVDKLDLVVRIEDLKNIDYCSETLRTLTGLEYGEELIALAVGRQVNQRSGAPASVSDIVAKFTSRQRDWYSNLLAEIAPCFGYSLFE